MRAKRISIKVSEEMVKAAVAEALKSTPPKIKMVEVKIITVNGQKVTTYNGGESLSECLRSLYETQGNFYKEKFDVSFEDADAAQWHPQDTDFNPVNCGGWKKFLNEKGIITKLTTVTQEDPMELIIGDRVR